MSTARTLLYYFEKIAEAAGVSMDSDMRAELRDALESQEENIAALRQDVRALRAALNRKERA